VLLEVVVLIIVAIEEKIEEVMFVVFLARTYIVSGNNVQTGNVSSSMGFCACSRDAMADVGFNDDFDKDSKLAT
jgi:hypothetical protein